MSTAEAAPTECVGPDYRSESQKPTATVSTKVNFEAVTVLPQTPQLIALLTCVSPVVPDPSVLALFCSPLKFFEWGAHLAHMSPRFPRLQHHS